MPEDDADALRAYMRVDDARNLEDYLARFGHTLSVMQTEEAMERIAYELAEDCAREGVRYLEVRYAPILNTRGGLSLGQAVEAPLKGLAMAEREYGIVARVLVCALRWSLAARQPSAADPVLELLGRAPAAAAARPR